MLALPQGVGSFLHKLPSPIILDIGQADKRLVARLSGDTHLLLEIGAPELDLVLRLRGHALMLALEAQPLAGVIRPDAGHSLAASSLSPRATAA